MKLPIYQIDAFTDEVFRGNPAAVCPLSDWLPDSTMQDIATENNLSETAFFTFKNGKYLIRWFTPTTEVDLCGHATLAAAFVIKNFMEEPADVIEFQSPRSGDLSVSVQPDGLLTLDFPTDTLEKVNYNIPDLNTALGKAPSECWKGKTDYLAIYEDRDSVLGLRPDMKALGQIKARGIIVTGPGGDVDFVSRFFGPASGIDEDPVTGSAHTSLTPYWSKKLGKKKLTAKQISSRGGYLVCESNGERTKIGGYAAPYMKGEIEIAF